MLTLPAGYSVQIADLRSVAATFGRLHDDTADLVHAASSALAGTGGMAGQDAELAKWRAPYDAVASAYWPAATAAVDMLGAIEGKLHATAEAYRGAEHFAEQTFTPGATGPPGREGHPAARVFTPPSPPPASTGPVGPDVDRRIGEYYLAEYYPGGEPELLRAAGTAWSRLAEGLNHVELTGDQAFQALLWTGEGATFSAMRTFWGRQFTPCASAPLFNVVADTANVLGTSCTRLADVIDTTRRSTVAAAFDAVDIMEPFERPAALLAPLTRGITELELVAGIVAFGITYLDDSRLRYFDSLDGLVARLTTVDQERLRQVAVPPPPDQPTGVGLDDVGRITGLELGSTAWDTLPGPHPDPDTISITPARSTHVLVGDKTGGGHAPGTGKPGKSEFPPGWSNPRILAAAFDVARNPDMVTRSRIPGRWVAVGRRDGTLIRVIVLDDGSIWTVVPLEGAGVVTNPK